MMDTDHRRLGDGARPVIAEVDEKEFMGLTNGVAFLPIIMPSRAEPSRAEPSRAEPSRAEPSQ